MIPVERNMAHCVLLCAVSRKIASMQRLINQLNFIVFFLFPSILIRAGVAVQGPLVTIYFGFQPHPNLNQIGVFRGRSKNT